MSKGSIFSLLALSATALAPSCGDSKTQDPTHPNRVAVQRIECQTARDCVARGGACVAGQCRAQNECATDADCSAGGACVSDPNFGGLCRTGTAPVVPEPPWACTLGQDCPAGQGCGSDGTCHADGECTPATGSAPQSGCAGAMVCFNAGNDGRTGICDDDGRSPRSPDWDPWCRSDGAGACRLECDSDGTCLGGAGMVCVGTFCHARSECATNADCSPNHVWQPDSHGYSVCQEDSNPTCVMDATGACRLRCQSDADCVEGGGCRASDGLCHASNECAASTDCPAGQICYPSAMFGGLCGASR